ncbi:transposase [Cerasicoccus arenae]|uniref:Transposase n=1 Tax=Cerasicoccus arenae TaxID=424488 RepID=A0A8J3GD72_9BACT|nr:transposase [Cerasicoccus arenae]MBK1859854.1 transposase [Cerasicoccus arenae]GHB93442.1 transposase [Cerasicoccus arenae]
MKRGRRKTEDIIRILRDSEGLSVDEACRKHGISQATFNRYKKQFGGMSVKEAQRLRELEKENAELKKLLADQLLKARTLEIALEKNV